MSLNNEKLDLSSLSSKQLWQLKLKWPKNLVDLVCVVDKSLANEKLDEPLLAEKIIAEISFYLGGRDIYIPKGKPLSDFLRNIRIYQAFNGRNSDDLAVQYGLTCRQINNIIKQVREINRQSSINIKND
ncbi:Mor transcription activator family protein [Shewanella waksmanii]|uniref:Mor transcription activator family protein n=1 Tax=Shewanella waksmanii TaxID=213783 RepID=UPI0004AE8685|nr:Mor transcription activator family protein [Shewanella waksmanii]